MNLSLLFAAIVHCYVGSNTGSADRQALHVLACDTETGAARVVQSVTNLQGTTYFELDREGRYLYSMIAERKGGRSVGSIVRFPLDGWRLGEPERIAELPCEAPCHLALTPDGTRVAFAAYCSATCGTVGIDGKGLRTFVFPDDRHGPNPKRQQKAYAHQVFFTRSDALRPAKMGVVDLGSDRIWFFDPETMDRKGMPTVGFDPGDGPRHALFKPDVGMEKVLYVINELGNSVSAFAYDGAAFTRFQKIPTLPDPGGEVPPAMAGETAWSKAAAIKLTADGRILMASNRGDDSIAFYEVGPGGKLTLMNIAKLTGRFPRDFELMPGEKFMIVGHKLSNEVQVYRFDRRSCELTPVGEPLAIWRPLCFKFRNLKITPNG